MDDPASPPLSPSSCRPLASAGPCDWPMPLSPRVSCLLRGRRCSSMTKGDQQHPPSASSSIFGAGWALDVVVGGGRWAVTSALCTGVIRHYSSTITDTLRPSYPPAIAHIDTIPTTTLVVHSPVLVIPHYLPSILTKAPVRQTVLESSIMGICGSRQAVVMAV
jgi:hypothetical protein